MERPRAPEPKGSNQARTAPFSRHATSPRARSPSVFDDVPFPARGEHEVKKTMAEEPTRAAVKDKPKQRLSTPQMLHLMRLEMDGALRHGYPISCMVIGLDGFDEDGERAHRKQIMPEIFRLLKRVTFENDVRGLGIWADRHEVAVFPHVTPEKIEKLAQAMLDASTSLVNPVAPETPLTLSVGISHNLRPGPISFELLIEEAETGMGLAQGGGGNRFVLAREVETEIDRLREELEVQIKELSEFQESLFGDQEGQHDVWGQNLIARALELFREEPDQSQGVFRLEKAVIALIRSEVKAWRESSTVTQMIESQREIERLERRVLKLTESLGMTEKELQRIAALKNIDLGISSIYRTVQGLQSDDGNAEQKKEMLKNLFEANLSLRSELAKSRAS
jgi:GGDEF domain-containing protein